MGKNTGIHWCDDTVNPVMGCSGCELFVPGRGGVCYAGNDHDKKGQISKGYAPIFHLPTLYPGRTALAARAADLTGTQRVEKPWLDGMPRLIFVSDMGDALSNTPFAHDDQPARYVRSEDVEVTRWGVDVRGRPVPKARAPREGTVRDGGVPFEFLKAEVIDVAMSAAGSRHQWLWLSKLPQRMAEFSTWLEREQGFRWPPNVWAGTSVTGSGTLWRAHALADVGDEHTLRFLSVEPLWNEVSLLDVFARRPEGRWWVVHGGESKQAKDTNPRRYDLGWARRLRDECAASNVPFFMKQLGGSAVDNGKPVVLTQDRSHGADMMDWPEDLRVRQMPTGPWSKAAPTKSTAIKAPAISPIGRTHAAAVAERAARSPEYREAREARQANWSQADVVDWAAAAKPHVRKAILLLALATGTMTTGELNERVGSTSGGAILGGLLRAATGRGLRHPVVRVGDGWRFRSAELGKMFAAALAPSAATTEQPQRAPVIDLTAES